MLRGGDGSIHFRFIRVLVASLRTYAKDLLAYYSSWGFLLVRLSIPLFMIATAWALARIASPGGLVYGLGYTDYIGFVALGFAFFSMLTTTLFEVGEKMHRELVQGTLEIVLVTPASRAAWLAGNALGSLMVSFIDVVLVIAYYAGIFGMERISIGMIPHALLGILLGVMGMMGMGLILGGIVINLKEPHAFNVLLIPFLILLTGMMFPVEALPDGLQQLSKAIPLTHSIEIAREAVLKATPLWMLEGKVKTLVVQAITYTTVGYIVFKILEDRARKTGNLIKF